MVDHRSQSDIVEQAFDELRTSQPPEGPTAQAMERALQAVRKAQEKSERISIVERIRKMNRLIKYPVAAAIALALLVGAGYLLLGPSAGSAFAAVRQQIEQAQTMTVIAKSEMKNVPGVMITKMYFKSPGRMRAEMFAPAPASAQGSQPASSPSPVSIAILDMAKLKVINLIPQQKKAGVIELKNFPPEMIEEAKQQNFLDQLKKQIAGEHKDLGEKTVEGKKAHGYRIVSNVGNAEVTMDIWADASTGVPVLIEQTLPEGMGKVTMTDFVMNPKLDDSLFDTKVPEGYEVEKQTIDMNMNDEQIARLMGLLAKYYGGEFPKVLMVTPELIKGMEKAKVPQEEAKEFSMLLTKVIAFQVGVLSAEGEFVYAGEGVKLGDKTTPILWYKKKDEKKYHVFYGDLRMEMSDKAPATRPASKPSTKPASAP